MKKITLLACCIAMATSTMAQIKLLEGFKYAHEAAPKGDEWQSPQQYALNKEQPRANFFSFADQTSAQKVLPENSAYYKSLDGTWQFHWVANPDERPKDFYKPTYNATAWDKVNVPMSWNIYGIQKDGSLKYGVPVYVNQKVIFWHQVKVGDWKGGVMRTPPKNWTTYKYRNEVGSYRRTFTIPKDWEKHEVFINFDGVDSFFYLWINGQYIGFSKNSRDRASFNITPYLQEGENLVAAEVYRNSDGSFLEAQDMQRLPGIFRTVSLTAKPQVYVRDLQVIPDLDGTYTNGVLNITADVRNASGKKQKGYTLSYKLYATPLYSDATTLVQGVGASSDVADMQKGEASITKSTLYMTKPHLWSAEEPYRYVLVGQLKDKKGRIIETFSTYTGFRKVEIKDTPAAADEFGLAGRYYYINGKTVKLKGVNRHETNPSTGHVISHEQMEKEIFLMKRANINHVRNSHYPDNPYWYYLCNKYGIYLEDEANTESHEYYYGKESLSHVPEFKAQHVNRMMEMVHSNINNPSIVIWSLGNEAGPGENFVATYKAAKAVDTSRPIQYERNNDIVDMGSNQYPSIDWVRGAVTGKYNLKYPFHISEYAHSMGNACGNLVDYWNAIESTNFLCGGAIWDWVDQSMYNYDPATGTRYLSYGGDFGDYPTDGMFVMNGIVFGDLSPKPQYYEVKKVYQYIGIKAVDIQKGLVEIFNKNYFTDLSQYEAVWSLYQDGKSIEQGKLNSLNVAPRQRTEVTIPYDHTLLKPTSEYFIKIQFVLRNNEPWAKAGFVQAEEQLPLQGISNLATISSIAKGAGKLTISDAGKERKRITGKDFTVDFDLSTGTIYSLTYGNNKVIADGNGPKLDAYRAPADNDNWARSAWVANGLHNLKHVAKFNGMYTRSDGAVSISFTVTSQAPNAARLEGGESGRNKIIELKDQPFGPNNFKFISNQIWMVYPDGSIELQAGITSNKPSVALPRLGYEVIVPKAYENYTYYGRGPINNYADRKTGQFIEQHSSTVKDQFVNFPKPQTMANREEVRWTSLTNAAGEGVIFIGGQPLSVSALPYSAVELTLAPHGFQLPAAGDTHLKLDLATTGLGGNSCGQGPPLLKDRVFGTTHAMSFIIRPTTIANLSTTAKVSPSGDMPLSQMRSGVGAVTLTSSDSKADIRYTIDGGKEQRYTAPFNLRNGGKVVAWYANKTSMKVVQNYPRIKELPLTIAFASSQETGSGDAKNLLDGDVNSLWHTMYSVTVASYPHWIDFDAGEIRYISGFTYLPRQSGDNGDIKTYRIQVSNDGKNWSKTIKEGSFVNDKSLKTVHFTPIKARFLRFTALSSQNGQDYASGAEFRLLYQDKK